MQPLTLQHLDILRSYDTATICNVIELFNVRPPTAGYMDGRIRAVYPGLPPMVGFAVTATFQSSSRPSGLKPGYEQMHALCSDGRRFPGPFVAVFQDLDEPSVAATYGDMMANCIQKSGGAGIITSGAGRDIEQIRAMNLPCFAGSINPSHGYPSILETGVPVQVGGCTIRPGDLLHGDSNGVTTIPGDIAARVAETCQDYVDVEERLLGYLRRTPDPGPDMIRYKFEEMSNQVKLLSERVSGA